MRVSRRAFLRTTGTGAAVLAATGLGRPAHAQKKQVVTIAFPETVTSMDPHPAPRNSPRESMYESVFDRFLQQDRQGKYGPERHRELAVDRRQDGHGRQGPSGDQVPRRVGSHRRGRRLQHEPAEGDLDLQGDLRAGQGVPGPRQGHDAARLRALRPLVPALARLPGRLRRSQGLLPVPRPGRQGARRGVRAEARRLGAVPGRVLHAGEHAGPGGVRPLLEGRAADQAGGLQDGHRSDGPGRRDRVRQRGHRVRGPGRGVRAAVDPAHPQGREAAGRGHGADLPQPALRAVQEGGGAPRRSTTRSTRRRSSRRCSSGSASRSR